MQILTLIIAIIVMIPSIILMIIILLLIIITLILILMHSLPRLKVGVALKGVTGAGAMRCCQRTW